MEGAPVEQQLEALRLQLQLQEARTLEAQALLGLAQQQAPPAAPAPAKEEEESESAFVIPARFPDVRAGTQYIPSTGPGRRGKPRWLGLETEPIATRLRAGGKATSHSLFTWVGTFSARAYLSLGEAALENIVEIGTGLQTQWTAVADLAREGVVQLPQADREAASRSVDAVTSAVKELVVLHEQVNNQVAEVNRILGVLRTFQKCKAFVKDDPLNKALIEAQLSAHLEDFEDDDEETKARRTRFIDRRDKERERAAGTLAAKDH